IAAAQRSMLLAGSSGEGISACEYSLLIIMLLLLANAIINFSLKLSSVLLDICILILDFIEPECLHVYFEKNAEWTLISCFQRRNGSEWSRLHSFNSQYLICHLLHISITLA